MYKSSFIPQRCQHLTIAPPVRDAVVMRYVENEIQPYGTQRSFTLTDFDVQPCNYDCLLAALKQPGVRIPLKIWNGKMVDRNFGDAFEGQYVNASSTELESHFTSKAIGLVRGGWLPSAMAATRDDSAVILDRCVIDEIVHHLENGMPRGRKPDFLELFAGRPILLSPALCALESNTRSLPDHATATIQLKEVGEKLRRALPDARILDTAEIATKLDVLVDGCREPIERGQRFLLELAPRLSPISRTKRGEFWEKVLGAADRHGVARRSLPVLAVLSAGLMPNGKGPARKVLKPSLNYDAGDAYNAMLDLTALDLLIRGICFLPERRIQLCTRDHGLAKFWCAIQASDFHFENGAYTYSLTPNSAILPEDLVEQWLERTK